MNSARDKKVSGSWKRKSPPSPRGRLAPGTTGRGEFFHVEVRPRSEFVAFRTQDVGRPGGIERVAGRRPDGSWDTQKWLISKTLARIERRKLVPTNSKVRELLDELNSSPQHVAGDRFKACSSPTTRRSRPRPTAKAPTKRKKLAEAYQNIVQSSEGKRGLALR